MKKSDGNRRIVAYLSIGEAEDYRPYWKKEWKEKRPGFLVEENKEWKGNFRVRYWRKDWQAIVFSYLETIVNQGFDGVYLDIVDGYEFFEKGKDNCINPETKRSYRQNMKLFVTEIVQFAKQRRPVSSSSSRMRRRCLKTVTTWRVWMELVRRMFSRTERGRRKNVKSTRRLAI